jgi:putative ABC transport system permease protein
MNFLMAWRNLLQNKRRTAAALGGITFAVLLVFMQLGFLRAARAGSAMLYESFDFDLALVSRHYESLNETGRIDRMRLIQAAIIPDVRKVAPLSVLNLPWRNVAADQRFSFQVVGVPPDPDFIRDPRIRAQLPALAAAGTVLVDTWSHRDCGDITLGRDVEINGRRLWIAGHYAMGAALFAEGGAFIDHDSFLQISRRGSRDVTFGLVKIAPGRDPDTVAAALRAGLPKDVLVFTRAGLIRGEQDYFVSVKPVGIIFKVGVFVAFVVGVVILFQVLSTEISNRLKEYATLKAIGFTPFFIYSIGVIQALLFAALSFLPAVALSAGVFWAVRTFGRLPALLDAGLLLLVLGLTLVMCALSTLLALRKVRRAAPAELF